MPKPNKKQTWSNIDVFGLVNGIAIWDDQYKSLRYVRKPFENNLEIKDRIYANHDYPGDVDKQGLLNGISSEFGLTPYNVINKTIFELSYKPIPSGNVTNQDISGFYKDSSGNWQNIGPQIWSAEYELAKSNQEGFIVWQNSRFANISGYKNYSYSNIVEVLAPLADQTQVKFEYWREIKNEDNVSTLVRYTDMNNQTDTLDDRFTYRIANNDPNLSGQVVLYTLNEIPTTIKDETYYDKTTGIAKSFTYSLKEWIDKKFRHTWDKARTGTVIWDVHRNYGSGEIPSFYDALSPNNTFTSGVVFNNFRGGVEPLSYTFYPEQLVEQSGETQEWYLKLYPGKFYVDGLPYYHFEDKRINQINFSPVSGYLEADIPSGLEKGMYTILAKSGYYDSYMNVERDEYLSGIYEDYCYFTGPDGDKFWYNIYRKRPNISTIKGGFELPLNMGDYRIDYRTKKITANLPSDYTEATLVWDHTLVPSGTLLEYDFNPLNEQNLAFDKFFVYLATDSNRR